MTSSKATGRKGDTGAADPAVTAALDAWARGAGSERDALAALAWSRLIVPVVAMLTEQSSARPAGGTGGLSPLTGGAGAEKETEMALPTLVGKDGRKAVIAFTGTESVRRWNPEARPVPFLASRVWEYAAAEGDAVVIDVAGPVPLAVEGSRLAALAAGDEPPLPHEDPDVRAEIAAVAGDFTVEPGPPGSDFLVTLHGADAAQARRAAEEITARVRAGGRFRRGVGFRVALYPERMKPTLQESPLSVGDGNGAIAYAGGCGIHAGSGARVRVNLEVPAMIVAPRQLRS
jgi:hypothetical protein